MARPWPLKSSPVAADRPETRTPIARARTPVSVRGLAMVGRSSFGRERKAGRRDGCAGRPRRDDGLVRSGCRGLVGSKITSQHLHRVFRPGQAPAALRRTPDRDRRTTIGPLGTYERRLSPMSTAPARPDTDSEPTKGTDHVQP